MRRFLPLLLLFCASIAGAQTATLTLNDGNIIQATPNIPGVNLSYYTNYDTGQITKNYAGTYNWNFNQIISRQIMVTHAAGSTTVWTDPNIDNQPLQNYWAGGTALIEHSQTNAGQQGCSSLVASNLGQTNIVSGSISGSTATLITSIPSGFTPGALFYVKNTSNNAYNQYTGGTITSVSGTTLVVLYTGSTIPTGTTTGGTVGQIGNNTYTLSAPCAAAIATGDTITITKAVGPTPAAEWANNSSGVFGFPTGLSSDTTDLCATCGDQALAMDGTSGQTQFTFPYDAADQNINIFRLMRGTFTLSFDAKSVSGSLTPINLTLVRGGTNGVNCGPYSPTLTTGWAHYTVSCTANEIGIATGDPNCKAGGPTTSCTNPTTIVTPTFKVNGGKIYIDNFSITNNADTNSTSYNQDFITALQNAKPGYLRYWGNQNAQTIDNWTRPDYAQDITGVAGDYGGPVGAANTVQGLEDYLVLNQMLGTQPYLEIPVTFNATEGSQLIDFLAGDGTTTYGARRIALGQTAPWTSVFSHIYLTFCNECWNGNFANQNLPDRGSAPTDQLYYDYANTAAFVYNAMRANANYNASVIKLGFDAQTPVEVASATVAVAKPDFIEIEGYWWNNNNSWDASCGLVNPPATNDSCLYTPVVAQLFTVANGPVFNQSSHTGDPLNIYKSIQDYSGYHVCGPSGTAACQVTSYETGPGLLGGNNGTASPQGLLDQANAGAMEAALTAITFGSRVKSFNLLQHFFAATGFNNGGANGNTFKGWGFGIDNGGATHNLRPEYYGFQMLTTSMIGSEYQCDVSGTGTTISTPYLNYAGIGPGTGPGQNKGTSIVSTLPYLYSYCYENGSNRSILIINTDTANTWTVNLTGTNAPSGTVTKRDFNPSGCTNFVTGWSCIDAMNEKPFGTGSTFETASQTQTVTTSISAPSSVTLHPGEMVALDYATGGTPTAFSPTFSPVAGTYSSTQSVALSTTTVGAVICYTTDGTTPTASPVGSCTHGSTYSIPITVSSNLTINAIATKTAFFNSSVASATYVIAPPAPTPTFNPNGGTYTSPQSVTITDAPNKVTMIQYAARSGFNMSGSLFTPAFNLPFAVTQGNTVIVALFLQTAPASPLSLTNGSGVPVTFSLLASHLSGGSGLYIYGATNVPQGQLSITPTTTPVTNGASVIMEYQGLVNASLLDTSSFGAGTSTTLTSGSVTPTANEYLLSILGQNSISSIPASSGGGFTLSNVGPGNVLGNPGLPSVAYLQIAQQWGTAGTAYNASWNNLTSGANSIAGLLAIKSIASPLNLNAVMGQYTGGTNGSSPFSVLANPTLNTVQAQDAISLATTSATFNPNIPVTSGNTGVIYVWEGQTATLPTIVDSLSNVWTLAGSITTISGLYAFTSPFTHSGTPTITVNAGSGNSFGATFAEYSGVGILDVVASGSTTGSGTIVPTTAASITTTATDLMIDGIALYFDDFPRGTSGFNLSASVESVVSGVGNADMSTFDVVAPSGTYTTPVYYELDVINPPIYATGIEQLIIGLKTSGVTPNYVAASPYATPIAGATIHYTTNGTTPTLASPTYTGPLTVSTSETINAIAIAPGFSVSSVGTATFVIGLPPAVSPTFSPVAGTYATAQSVTLATTTSGGVICYKIGSAPSASAAGTCDAGSTTYSTAISVSASQTIFALTTKVGLSNSAVSQAAYIIEVPASTPTFSPVAGTYTSPQTVTILDSTPSASIFYTINGTTPTPSSTPYTGPIPVNVTTTIKAIVTAPGFLNSAIGTAIYTLNLPVAGTPTFTPVAGTYTSVQSVTLASSTSGASIFYTTDGSTPTPSSTPYTGAISVGSTQTINAIATKIGFTNSTVGTATYTINLPPVATPTFTPPAGTYSSTQSVAISSTTVGASIYYTVDGSTPTPSSNLYTGPISVATSQTIRAIGALTGFSNSAIGSASYTITSTSPGCSINGTVTFHGTVTLTCPQ